MKIKLFYGKAWILAGLLLCSVISHAQIRLALYGGVHSASVIEQNSLPDWQNSLGKYYTSKTGFQAGFLAEIPVGGKGFYLQPALVYVSKGRKFAKYYDSVSAPVSDTVFAQSNLSLSYIEVPLYVTYKIALSANKKNHFFLSAGPYFGFFFNGSMNLQNRIYSTNKFSDQDIDLEVGNAPGKYKTFDFGLSAKAGFELGNVMISAYLSRGLSSFYTASYDGSFHHSLVGATLGIWLTKATEVAKPPKDSDGDGIPDPEDACPLQSGSVNWKGCPVPDTDHDGVNDESDSCRTIAGTAKYHGCPVPDTDHDGVNDDEDSCINTPGSALNHGCPAPDRDADGVSDADDRCPDQPGLKENGGCPIEAAVQEKINFDAQNVRFKSSSSQLTTSSYVALDEIAGIMRAHPTSHLTISGHTDASGNQDKNLTLSQQRADAVKQYLVQKGISEGRIAAKGYGSQVPLGSNKTTAGKALNRRVEFKLE